MDLNELKKLAVESIEHEKEAIVQLSRYINENPETAYKEELARIAISGFLSERGFDVLSGAGGLNTSFLADFGSTEPAGAAFAPVALLAEYDALPGVGHGCGHNLIAAGVTAAAIGTAAAVTAAGLQGCSGAFRLIGTPAEEILSEAAGKTRLIEAGIFKNVGAALMFHPWFKTGVARHDLGLQSFKIVFSGRTAHAAADPWNGLNALDAAVTFYNSISMLRQQLPAGMRMHCIIPEGGEALNIIPDTAVVEVMLRSTKQEDLIELKKRIDDCINAASSASGCSAEITSMASVKPVKFNQDLFDVLAQNMEALGEKLVELPVWQASSDFGDVSHELPSLSLLYKTHEEGVVWHSRDVARMSAENEANEAMLRASKMLATTAIDLIYSKNLSIS